MKKILPLIILTLSVTFGCNENKQAAKKAAWLIAHDKLGSECNLMFPPKPDSVYVRDTITRHDTSEGKSVVIRDTVPCNGSTIIREIKCPPPQVINNYHERDSIIYRDNPNLRAAYDQQLRSKDATITSKDALISNQEKRIKDNDWWKIACIITWAGILVIVLVKLKI